jgi:hypothetical protein
MQWLRINQNPVEIEKYPLRPRNPRSFFNGGVAGGGHLHKMELTHCRAKSEHAVAGLAKRNKARSSVFIQNAFMPEVNSATPCPLGRNPF